MAIYLGENEVQYTGLAGGYMVNGKLLTSKTYTFNLGQTNYGSLTPSTTAQNLTLPATTYTASPAATIVCFRLGENYDGTIINRDEHDYVVFSQVKIDFNYGTNNVNSTIHGVRFAYARDNQEGKYRAGINASTGNLTSTYTKNAGNVTTSSILLYQKADNTYAFRAAAVGIFGAPDATFNSGGTPAKDYIDLRCTAFKVQGNATYFPVEALTALNPANTTITVTWQVYEGDKSSYSNIINTAYELAANS